MEAQLQAMDHSLMSWGVLAILNTVTQWIGVTMSNIIVNGRDRATACIVVAYMFHTVPLPSISRTGKRAIEPGCEKLVHLAVMLLTITALIVVSGNMPVMMLIKISGMSLGHALAVANVNATVRARARLALRLTTASALVMLFGVAAFTLSYPDHDTAYHLLFVIAPARHVIRLFLHWLLSYHEFYHLFIAISVDFPLFVCTYAFVCDTRVMVMIVIGTAVIDVVFTSWIVYSPNTRILSYNWSYALWLQLISIGMMGVLHKSARDINVSCSRLPQVADLLERIFLAVVYVLMQAVVPSFLAFAARLLWGTERGNTPVKQKRPLYVAARVLPSTVSVAEFHRLSSLVAFVVLIDSISAQALAFYVYFFELHGSKALP